MVTTPAPRRACRSFLHQPSVNHAVVFLACTTPAQFQVATTVLDFDWSSKVPLLGQLNEITRADILLSMHGAGLAHLIFLPPWSALHNTNTACFSSPGNVRMP